MNVIKDKEIQKLKQDKEKLENLNKSLEQKAKEIQHIFD